MKALKSRPTIPDCSEPGIYAITDHKGNRYVGSSLNVGRRWRSHADELESGIHHNYRLQSAWSAYGADKFTFSLLEGTEPHDLLLAEQRWIDKLDPHYNLAKVAARPHMGDSRARFQKYKMEREIEQCRKYYRDLAICWRLNEVIKLADMFSVSAILFDAYNPNAGGPQARTEYAASYARAVLAHWPWDDSEEYYYRWQLFGAIAEDGLTEALADAYSRWPHPMAQSIFAMSDDIASQRAIDQDRRLEYSSEFTSSSLSRWVS